MNVPALLATYQLRQREYLLQITRAMTSSLDLPSVLRLILRSAAEMADARAGLIVLVRDEVRFDETDEYAIGNLSVDMLNFQIRAFYGLEPETLHAFEPLLDTAPLASESTESEPDGTSQALQQRVRLVEDRLGEPLGKVVGLPLPFDNELLGIIYLFRSEHAFTELDSQYLQGFAYQAAIAVRNARLYQQLETERTRLQKLIENNINGIMIMDVDLRVLVMNQALADMLDVDPERVIDMLARDVLRLNKTEGDNLLEMENFAGLLAEEGFHCVGDLVYPSNSQRRRRTTVDVTFTPLYEERRSTELSGKELPLHEGTGSERNSPERNSPERPERGRLVNIIVDVSDITRFREEEEMQSTFTSIISHELKTPVALIKGYAQTLARPDAEWDAETAAQGLQIIEEEADRLEGLINNLLDASRIQAGGLRLDLVYVNIKNLVTKVANAYHTQTEQHQIELDFRSDLPPVYCDEERVRQVLTNLIGNAIKYSPDGGRIRIGGWTDFMPDTEIERVVIYVADEGIGVPQEEIAHIFSRFYRVDSSLRRGTAGAGLGLFLSKEIVEAHYGQIWARSEPEKGTTFFFALPIEEMGQESEPILDLGG